jgi:hypothetical protein
MTIPTQDTSRTARLLALMKKGDDAFNARDFAAVDEVHHPAMVAYITGLAEPVYGKQAHGAAMQQMLRMFPDMHVYSDPYPVQFGSGDWITVVTNATGTFTGEMALPDGTVIPPTGKAFDVEFGQTSKWDGDQLIIISAFWDAALQRQQLGLLQVDGGDEGQAGDALVGAVAVGDAVDHDHVHLEVVGAQVGDLLVGGGFVPASGAAGVRELDHDDAHAPRALQDLRRGVMDPEPAAERVERAVDPPQVLGDLRAGVDEAANVGDDESGHGVIPFGGVSGVFSLIRTLRRHLAGGISRL